MILDILEMCGGQRMMATYLRPGGCGAMCRRV
jgi:NADH:ubiquinone oxidoreductase subunit D